MRLTKKRVEGTIAYVCGNDVLGVVEKLRKADNVSEFKIADMLKEDIKRVRNMLYRLYEANLVSFVRKKDKKKGWYIYYWSFNLDQVKYLLVKMKNELLERYKEKLKTEEDFFFMCPNECVRLDFDQAVDFEYHCPECGELVESKDRTSYTKKIKKEIEKIEKELK